jgi:hypothetical protein
MAHLSAATTPRAPAPPRQMGRTRRKEKQSARTVRPKTLREKGNKKRRRETREDFSRKEKYMRFAHDDAKPEEQRASRPRATKGKTSPD